MFLVLLNLRGDLVEGIVCLLFFFGSWALTLHILFLMFIFFVLGSLVFLRFTWKIGLFVWLISSFCKVYFLRFQDLRDPIASLISRYFVFYCVTYLIWCWLVIDNLQYYIYCLIFVYVNVSNWPLCVSMTDGMIIHHSFMACCGNWYWSWGYLPLSGLCPAFFFGLRGVQEMVWCHRYFVLIGI